MEPSLNDVAMASLTPQGQPIIRYNPNVLARLSQTSRLFWYLHECGHHALAHTLGRNMGMLSEREADCWAAKKLRELKQMSTERLRNNPLLGPVRSLHSVSGSIDLKSGLIAHAYLDLGSPADAAELKQNADTQLQGMRSQPALKMMGLVGYLNGIKTEAKASTFQLDVELSQPQVDDLVNRLSGMAGMLGGGPAATSPRAN